MTLAASLREQFKGGLSTWTFQQCKSETIIRQNLLQHCQLQLQHHMVFAPCPAIMLKQHGTSDCMQHLACSHCIPVQDPYEEMSGAYTTSKSGRTHRSTGMTTPSGNMSAGNFRASCAGAALLPTAKTGVSTSPFGSSHLVL